MSTLRIAHIINNLSLGGAEILLKNSIELMPDHQHLIIYLSPPDDVIATINGNVEAICLHNKSWMTIYKSAAKARRILKKWKPSVVHAHLFDATLLARFAIPRKTPLISTIHSTYSYDAFQNKKALWLERLTVNRQDAIIAVSKFVLNDYLKHINFRKKCYVLYNFTPFKENVEPVPSIKPEPLKCVAVGNLKDAKNYEYLIEVFKLLKNEDVSLNIFGDGILKTCLQNRIDKTNVRVTLCGSTDHVNEMLPKYDIFIQASKHEGYGISVAEAMCCKLPLFLSDIPVFREVSNGHAVFFPLDNPSRAAQLLLSMKDISLRKKLVAEAFVHIDSLSSGEQYIENLNAIYYSLIEEKLCVASPVL